MTFGCDRRTRLVAVGLLSALAMTACGGREEAGETGTDGAAAAPGITDTEVTVGGTFPLSGPLAANGRCASGGVQALFEAVNAEGGVEMGDGKTRKLNFVAYDDGYDPARSVQNYQKLVNQDNVFAMLQTFGTPPNAAIMPRANADEVPQVFVHSGAALFSANQEENPWTIGWQPTYQSEGRAAGEHLVAQDKPFKVGVLFQNDDFGKAFLAGFEEAIQGSQVQIVGRETYEPTDPTVDAQISNLKNSGADVLFGAIAIPKLAANALVRSRQIGWEPQTYLVSVVSALDQVVEPANAMQADNLFSTAFVKAADNPAYADDPEMQEYFQRMKQYAPDANPRIVNCEFGYGAAATFVQALENMEEPTRESLMTAIDELEGADDVPLLLDGVTVDGSSQTEPPLEGVVVQRLEEGAWVVAD